MSAFRLSPLARTDLVEIVDYIASRNTGAAERMRDPFFATFTLLAQRPGMGHVRNDLTSNAAGVRFWPVGQYLVIYRATDPAIEIVRVLSD